MKISKKKERTRRNKPTPPHGGYFKTEEMIWHGILVTAVEEKPVVTDSKQVPEAALARKEETSDEPASDEDMDGVVGNKRRGIRLKQDLS